MTAAVSHKHQSNDLPSLPSLHLFNSINFMDIALIFAGVQKTMFGLINYVGDKDSLIKTVCIFKTFSQCWNSMVFHLRGHPCRFTDSQHSFVCKIFLHQPVSSSLTKIRIVEIPQLFHMREQTRNDQHGPHLKTVNCNRIKASQAFDLQFRLLISWSHSPLKGSLQLNSIVVFLWKLI